MGVIAATQDQNAQMNVKTIILDKIAVNDVMKRAKAATKQQVYVNMGVIRAGQECPAGYYGDRCSNSCGFCLDNSTCHHETGVCEQGCRPGYQTPKCISACDKRKYGINCSIPCGNCHEFEQSYHINGTCMNGCESSYQGLTCNEGRSEF